MGDPPAIPGKPSRQLGRISPAQDSPGWAGRGVPLLSPPALRRIMWTKHLKLVSPPAGSTCPSPSDAFPPERSLQNKSVLCINKAPRGAGEKNSAQELHKCSFFYQSKHRRVFFASTAPRPREGFLHLATQFPPLTGWEPNLSCCWKVPPLPLSPSGGFELKSQRVFPAGRLRCQVPRPAASCSLAHEHRGGPGVPTGGYSTVPPAQCPSPRSHLLRARCLCFLRL